jgi:hypothetical protein
MGWRKWLESWAQAEMYAHPGAPVGGAGPGGFRQAGPLDSDHGHVPHPDSPAGQSFDWHSLPGVDQAERVKAVYDAIRRCPQYVGAEIATATGEELHDLIAGILPGLLLMLGVMAVTTLGGAAAGAALGFLALGVGAAPGAAVGATLGAEAGATILEWLGLGFLAFYIGKNLGTAVRDATDGVKIAWHSVDSPRTASSAVDRAAHMLARAVADVFRAILQGIVAFLLTKGIAGAKGRLGELTAKLKASKLGEGFAGWIERSWGRLLENPKLKPKEIEGQGAGRGEPTAPGNAPPKPPPIRRIPVTGSRLQATKNASLHNQDWSKIQVSDFNATRPEALNPNALSPSDAQAADILKDSGYSQPRVNQILNSGNNFTPKEFTKGEPMYAFDSADYVGKDADSPYWMDQDSFNDVQSKFNHDGVWDRAGVKGYLALPCFNKADGLVQGNVAEDCTGVQSTIGPASENVTYQSADGTVVPESLSMPGGGTQLTPPPGMVVPSGGSP